MEEDKVESERRKTNVSEQHYGELESEPLSNSELHNLGDGRSLVSMQNWA